MRAFIAVALAIAAGICAFAIAEGLSGSLPVALLIAVLAACLTGFWIWSRPIIALDEAACSRGLRIVSGLATVAALVQLAHLTVFMVAPAQVAYSTVPSSAWEVRHSCLTAYFVAGEAVGRGQDAYDPALYTASDDTGTGQRKARMMLAVLGLRRRLEAEGSTLTV